MKFIATVEKLGGKKNYKGYHEPTILLLDIKDEKENLLTDHVWMNYGKNFKKARLHEGDVITLDARVRVYVKGYSEVDEDNPKRYDYKLSNPTRISIITPNDDAKHTLDECDAIKEIEERNARLRDARIASIETNSEASHIMRDDGIKSNNDETKFVDLYSFLKNKDET